MNITEVKREDYPSVVFLEIPIDIEPLEWAFEHLGCNALVVNNQPKDLMTVIAYASSPEANSELETLQGEIENSLIFRNFSESEVNSIERGYYESVCGNNFK